MILKGIVIQVRHSCKPPKSELKIQNNKNSYWIELRGKHLNKGKLLKNGDFISVCVISKAKETDKNTFNNHIVKYFLNGCDCH